ncbi:NAC domain-containing protein 105-like [Mercurialis annua]|uniref:NAC domain-containing protein 105-like n=1 Tax=Mercurialis annua TaxID=3986 RepID=UPI00215DF689|nr:NAC domain-containing protein 105-like [Mercurialis annua]
MLPGFRFNPTDQELVGFYLLHINNRQDSAREFPVPFCDFYGDEEPWQIWERFGGEQKNNLERLFFHTKLKKKATRGTGTNIDRKFGSGGGGWHGATSGEKSPIHVSDLVGYKKSFSYWNKSRPDQDRCWIMTEYSVEGRGWDFVICELKPGRKHTEKRKQEAAVLESGEKRCRIEQHNGEAVATLTDEDKGCRIERTNYEDEGGVYLQENEEGGVHANYYDDKGLAPPGSNEEFAVEDVLSSFWDYLNDGHNSEVVTGDYISELLPPSSEPPLPSFETPLPPYIQ